MLKKNMMTVAILKIWFLCAAEPVKGYQRD